MELLSWIFFGPAKLIELWPYAGAAIAGALIAVQVWLRMQAKRPFDTRFFREAPVFAGLLWLIFNAFELQVSAIGNQAANSPNHYLRMDLIVLVPILYVLTGAAIQSLISQARASVSKTKQESND